MLDLSLLVCTKNSAKNIIFCLNSALPILKAEAELIIVDGSSNDETIDVVVEFLKANNIQNYKLSSQLYAGLYEAFNIAIEIASRSKLFFLHSDDILKNTNVLISDLETSKADIIFYGVEIKGKFYRRKWHIQNLSGINVSLMYIPPHVGILVSNNVYNKVGNFLTNYKIAADFDWMLRLLSTSNLSFSFSNKIVYTMNSGGLSNSGLISELKKFFEDVKILKSRGFKLPIFRVLCKKVSKLIQLNKV